MNDELYFKFDGGKIRYVLGFQNEYNCNDDADMEILCNNLNIMIGKLNCENKILRARLDTVRDIVD